MRKKFSLVLTAVIVAIALSVTVSIGTVSAMMGGSHGHYGNHSYNDYRGSMMYEMDDFYGGFGMFGWFMHMFR